MTTKFLSACIMRMRNFRIPVRYTVRAEKFSIVDFRLQYLSVLRIEACKSLHTSHTSIENI